MPVYEDYVVREGKTKPAPNSYRHVAERHQHFMCSNLGSTAKFSTGEPMTAVERRCREIEDDPAPGDYKPRMHISQSRLKGGAISKAKRKDLWGSAEEVPGPGAYDGSAHPHSIRSVLTVSTSFLSMLASTLKLLSLCPL
jgi:hypothetical protein